MDEPMFSLDSLRKQIDAIDDEIASLLMKRAELSLEIRKIKQKDNIDIYSSSRESQILERVSETAKNGSFPISQLRKIFMNIFEASRALQGDMSIQDDV
jgi:chorismate mutase/prephenate dehydratase